ncbi:CrcB protein [Parabacteroides sp. PFB2-12]|uniref:fluoride efflux transporter CrcB n=1 Tax=unclassified Parabacteroides TaxID=2649774 RepID=UPI002473F916|nr:MULTISPECIES: fluoride efflux transporter CrcB [unclassified Parabacteroides]MDH6342463.1 CrcB protein [Parabacteroides sp. PM6-13]MDH6390115.1 CrcB protein [Parabacteroides sp. PFB2-12]
MIKQLLWVGLGGGIGSIFRYLTSVWVLKRYAADFPLATFVVNMVGCLLIGLIVGLSFRAQWIDQHMKLFLVTGFCGGYTTFSTFSLENWGLLEAGNYTSLFLNIVGSVLLGILAVWIGLWLAKL